MLIPFIMTKNAKLEVLLAILRFWELLKTPQNGEKSRPAAIFCATWNISVFFKREKGLGLIREKHLNTGGVSGL